MLAFGPFNTEAANFFEALGKWIAFIIIIGVIVYAANNVLFSGKKELGSEIELAANRKPYYGDEVLEGRKLTRSLQIALLLLFVLAVGLPFYWIMEPARIKNANNALNDRFVDRGAALFAPTAQGGYNCAGCHGPKGVGGSASYNLPQADGSIKTVTWKAPALNTVLLRYSREEVLYVLTYGRPNTPMPAWGVAGGGALNDQQLQNLTDYLESIQLTPDQAQAEAQQELDKSMTLTNPDGSPVYKSQGEALFNMGLTDGFAGGAFSCARCHTPAWSYSSSKDQLPTRDGAGAFGPALGSASLGTEFPAQQPADPCIPKALDEGTTTTTAPTTTTTEAKSGDAGATTTTKPLDYCDNPFQTQLDFVCNGSTNGTGYGARGQGTGKMPGFCQSPPELALAWINKGQPRDPGPGMLTPLMVEKIVQYERSL